MVKYTDELRGCQGDLLAHPKPSAAKSTEEAIVFSVITEPEPDEILNRL
jgi:hypothetical protein